MTDYRSFQQDNPGPDPTTDTSGFSPLYGFPGLNLNSVPDWIKRQWQSMQPLRDAVANQPAPKYPDLVLPKLSASDFLPTTPIPAQAPTLQKQFWPPTNTTAGTVDSPDSTRFPTGLPPLPPRVMSTGDWNASPNIHIPIGGGPGNVMEAPTGTPAQPAPASTRPVASSAANPRPVSSRAPAVPRAPIGINLGYYAPTTGNARGNPTFMQPGMYGYNPIQGPLAANPTVNPNVPAANAQPVSAVSPLHWPKVAPWNYGPLQRGNVWQPSGGPHG